MSNKQHQYTTILVEILLDFLNCLSEITRKIGKYSEVLHISKWLIFSDEYVNVKKKSSRSPLLYQLKKELKSICRYKNESWFVRKRWTKLDTFLCGVVR